MTMRSMLATALLLLATAAPAQSAPGAEAPAFRALVDRALTGADPAVAAEMRGLAEAGNIAATAMLPLVLQWYPPVGSLAERNQQRRVNGRPVVDLAAELHPASGHWQGGALEDPQTLPGRAGSLLALGEVDKAALLMAGWVNMTGGAPGLPDVLFDPALPAWIPAVALADRLTLGRGGTDSTTLADLLRRDHMAGWMTVVRLRQQDETALAAFVAEAVPDTETARRRLGDAAALLAVSPPYRSRQPIDADLAARARALLDGRAEFAAVQSLCATACPASAVACEQAMLIHPGLPFGLAGTGQPFLDLVSTETFFASPRGRTLALTVPPAMDDPQALERARGVDACLAGAVEAAMAVRDGG